MTSPKPVRWWPALLIVVVTALALLILWIHDTQHRQTVVMGTLGTLVIATLLLITWALALSRLPARTRLGIAIGLVMLAGVVGLSVRIEGMSGDFVPILSWRWTEEAYGGASNPTRRVSAGPASDYPQFLGPARNASLVDIALKDWTNHPPREIWRRPVGAGWSAFAVVGTHAVTQEQRGELECVVSYDLLAGEERWVHADTARFETTIGGVGPRATPTIHEGRVYAYGALGQLNCLDLESGREIWSRNPIEENGVEPPDWGNSCSPLLHDGAVIVSAGGDRDNALIAFEAGTGAVRWQAGNSDAGYSSPTLVRVANQDQILIFNERQLAGHDAWSGEPLWTHPWPDGTFSTSQPVVLPGNRIFLSSGYGIGAKMFRIDGKEAGFTPSIVWESPRLKAKFTNVVIHGGYIYGLDDGILVCLDPETGQRKWKRGRYGHGQVLLVSDRLIVQTEDGDLALVDANPEAFVETASQPALDSKTWNNPAFAPPYLIVRNDREAICFELSLEPTDSS